ncbi:putative two-component sensor [Hydrogenimonas sp.]|nr:putative two-component sensor [Hydrogenimonas sp.]
MNRHSIFFKLNLIFIFALGALIALFAMMVKEIESQEMRILEKKAIECEADIRKIIVQNGTPLKERFEEHGYTVIEHPEEINVNLRPIFQPPPPSFSPALRERIEDGRLRIYRDDSRIYFELVGPKSSRMVAAPIEVYRPKWIALFFGGMTGIIILLYWTLRRSLIPLKTLAKQIRRFGEGETDISTLSNKRDEIAFVANQFDATVKKINAMKEARTLFMRNIMHELKTPITKGKLSVALLKEEQEAKILQRAFSRMEHLIHEMAEMEMITSRSLDLKSGVCDFRSLVKDAANLLFIEEERIVVSCRSCHIEADYNMMVIVLKNLIDNAIKYGSEDKVHLSFRKGTLEVINRGEPMSESFEKLLEPFSRDENGDRRESFGLGLYIVRSILEAHGATLSHRYEKGYHIFSIDGLKTVKRK